MTLLLKDRVIARVLPPGATEPVEVEGTVWGVTHEQEPHYDVRTDDYRVFANLVAADVRRVTP